MRSKNVIFTQRLELIHLKISLEASFSNTNDDWNGEAVDWSLEIYNGGESRLFPD